MAGLDGLSDAELIRRYEAVKGLRRTPEKDALLAEVTRRCRLVRTIRDAETGVGYTYDDAADSAVYENRSSLFVRARDAEIERLKALGRTIGRQATEQGRGGRRVVRKAVGRHGDDRDDDGY
jgi:hypothetical protein